MKKIKKNNINNQIRSKEVRLIDQDGENLGVIPTPEAIEKAKAVNLDLVEVSGGGGTPVCRIIDFNKYLYDQKAKFKKQKTKKTDLKEFKLGPNIDDGDMKVRIERGKKFLKSGNMVKYTVRMRGRENAHPEFAITKLKIIESELAEVAKVEQPAKRNGTMISMTLMPKSGS